MHLLGNEFDPELDEISFDERTQYEGLLFDFTSGAINIEEFISKAKLLNEIV
tara:strand:+ start:15722 stop:15877 length:156 start_codon:yes stop_codon:yes gene_type:complete